MVSTPVNTGIVGVPALASWATILMFMAYLRNQGNYTSKRSSSWCTCLGSLGNNPISQWTIYGRTVSTPVKAAVVSVVALASWAKILMLFYNNWMSKKSKQVQLLWLKLVFALEYSNVNMLLGMNLYKYIWVGTSWLFRYPSWQGTGQRSHSCNQLCTIGLNEAATFKSNSIVIY